MCSSEFGSLQPFVEKRFLEIADRTVFSRPFSERFLQIQVTRCEHHYIFFIHPERRRPCIIAVLHECMDSVARIKNRLD